MRIKLMQETLLCMVIHFAVHYDINCNIKQTNYSKSDIKQTKYILQKFLKNPKNAT
jgi:hypothetical protein